MYYFPRLPWNSSNHSEILSQPVKIIKPHGLQVLRKWHLTISWCSNPAVEFPAPRTSLRHLPPGLSSWPRHSVWPRCILPSSIPTSFLLQHTIQYILLALIFIGKESKSQLKDKKSVSLSKYRCNMYLPVYTSICIYVSINHLSIIYIIYYLSSTYLKIIPFRFHIFPFLLEFISYTR